MYLINIFILSLLGLFFGSFFGVLVDRLPRHEDVIKGRSHCENCKKELAWYDLLPVLSFVLLRGKCRYCKAKLSLLYPAIEISTGILFALTYAFFSSQFSILNFQLIYYLFIVSSFIVIFFTDLKYGIIPDKITYTAILVTFLWLIFGSQSLLINHLLSGAGAFLFFIVISYVFYFLTKKESMGGGDIKLSFLLGVFLGFPNIVISLYLAFLTGAFWSIILILWKRKKFRESTLPFGPFLVAGALVSIFWGDLIFSKVIIFLGF